MTRCCYKNCRSDSRKNKTVKFHPFPKSKTNSLRCLKWIELCGNEKLIPDKINKNSYVCSRHFQGRVTNSSNPIPFSPMPTSETDVEEITIIEADAPGDPNREQDISATIDLDNVLDHDYSRSRYNKDASTQTIEKSNIFSHDVLIQNKKKMKYLTGLNASQFEALFNFLDPTVMKNLQYAHQYQKKTIRYNRNSCKLTDKDRLCLTLIRLRRGFTLDEMSHLVNISRSQISIVFYTWIQFMYFQTQAIRENLFRSGRDMRKIPYCFRNFEGNNISMVIDGTEIALQMPSNFQQQGNTFSSYKHSNTVKFLVGICPSGAITYTSEGHEGSISDKELFEKSDIRNFLQNGDVLMADRGFLIQDICNELNIKLYTPPLLMRRPRLTGEEELITKKIAKARIHVERAIGRMKSYRILSKKCPILLIPVISNIFSVIAFLVNFEDCLVS